MGASIAALILATLVATATAQEKFNPPFHRRQEPYAGPGRNTTSSRPSRVPSLPPPAQQSTTSSKLTTSLTASTTSEEPRFSYDPTSLEAVSTSDQSAPSSTTELDLEKASTKDVFQFSYAPLSGQAPTSYNGTSTTLDTTSISNSQGSAPSFGLTRTRPPEYRPSYHYGPSGVPRQSPQAPLITAASYGISGQSRPSSLPIPEPHDACSGTTVNILDASLDWWYSETYTQVESTIVLQTNSQEKVTGWTVLTASTTLDITSAIENPTCISSTAFNDEADATVLQYSCWDTPTPVAAATTTVEQTAYKEVNITTGKGAIPDVVTSPTSSAALTVGNSSLSITSGAPVVHFSAYEVVNRQPSLHRNGSVGCAQHTRVHNLTQPYSFNYIGREDVNGTDAAEDGVTGRVQFAFLRALGIEDAVPGTFVADPTVVVVVEKVVAASVAQKKGKGIEVSEPVLETPSATLPAGLSYVETTPTEAGTTWVPLSPRVEQSESALEVPGRSTASAPRTTPAPAPEAGGSGNGQIEIGTYEGGSGNSKITLAVPVPAGATQKTITAVYNGNTITATKLSPNGNGGGGGGLGMLISAVASAAQPKPSNALDVLTKALDDQTAAEVATIIGAFPVGVVSGNGASGQGGGNGVSGGGGNGGSEGIVEGDAGASSPGNLGSSNGQSQSGNGANGGNGAGSAENGIIGTGSTGEDVPGGGGINAGGGSWPIALINIGTRPYTATVIEGQSGTRTLLIDGQTAVAGGGAITVDGTAISLPAGGSDIVIGGTTARLAITTPNPGAVANIPLLTIGSHTYTANAATQFNIEGKVLAPGSHVVVSSTTISLAAGATAVVVNGQTEQLSAPIVTPAPLLTLDGTVYKPNLGSTYNVGSQLLIPGGAAITVSGETISLLPGGSSVLINGVRYPVSVAGGAANSYPTITARPLLTIDGNVYSPNGATSYIISGQTLTPGGTITISRPNGIETISLNSAANQLLTTSNDKTITSPIKDLIGAASQGAPILTINGQTYTAIAYNPSGSGATYLINNQLLTPGGTITLPNDETLSLLPAGTAIILTSSGTTSTSTIPGAYGILPTNAPILTIGPSTYTPLNNRGPTYLIEGETLTPGEIETVTIDGSTYIVSLSPQATLLEIEESGRTSRETLFPATATTVVNTRLAATTGASPTIEGARPTGSGESAASSSHKIELASACLVVFGLMFAIWL